MSEKRPTDYTKILAYLTFIVIERLYSHIERLSNDSR